MGVHHLRRTRVALIENLLKITLPLAKYIRMHANTMALPFSKGESLIKIFSFHLFVGGD